MRLVLVQIYGVTNEGDASAVDEIGPDHIGVVVDEGVPTWDSVDPPTALAIRGTIRRSKVVALSLSTDPGRVLATEGLLQPDIVHLARAHLMTPECLTELRSSIGCALMLTVPVRDESAVETARRLQRWADYLLLDSADPESGTVGATGLEHDWQISAEIVKSVARPVILAGGLGPHNVVRAIEVVRPAGVDSETNTSCEGERRRKDLGKVRAFTELARAHGTSPG